MESRRAFEVATKLLREAGFNTESPEPARAWSAFKLFAAVPVSRNSTNSLCEIGSYRRGAENILFINLARQFEFKSRGEFSHFTQLRIALESPLGFEVDGEYLSLWSNAFENLENYIAAVEASPIFNRVFSLDGWKSEVCFGRV